MLKMNQQVRFIYMYKIYKAKLYFWENNMNKVIQYHLFILFIYFYYTILFLRSNLFRDSFNMW